MEARARNIQWLPLGSRRAKKGEVLAVMILLLEKQDSRLSIRSTGLIFEQTVLNVQFVHMFEMDLTSYERSCLQRYIEYYEKQTRRRMQVLITHPPGPKSQKEVMFQHLLRDLPHTSGDSGVKLFKLLALSGGVNRLAFHFRV